MCPFEHEEDDFGIETDGWSCYTVGTSDLVLFVWPTFTCPSDAVEVNLCSAVYALGMGFSRSWPALEVLWCRASTSLFLLVGGVLVSVHCFPMHFLMSVLVSVHCMMGGGRLVVTPPCATPCVCMRVV